MEGYPRIAKAALEILAPFVTSYLCEQGFSKLVEMKSKKRSRLDCENDMRVSLSKESHAFLTLFPNGNNKGNIKM